MLQGVTQWDTPTEAVVTSHKPVYALAANPTAAPDVSWLACCSLWEAAVYPHTDFGHRCACKCTHSPIPSQAIDRRLTVTAPRVFLFVCPRVQARKRLTPASRGAWKRIIDYSRMEATTAISAKSKKFAVSSSSLLIVLWLLMSSPRSSRCVLIDYVKCCEPTDDRCSGR